MEDEAVSLELSVIGLTTTAREEAAIIAANDKVKTLAIFIEDEIQMSKKNPKMKTVIKKEILKI